MLYANTHCSKIREDASGRVARFREDSFYFLSDAAQLVYDHLPDAPEWQLLARPVQLARFERMPMLKPGFFAARLDARAVSHDACVLEAPPASDIVLALPFGSRSPPAHYRFFSECFLKDADADADSDLQDSRAPCDKLLLAARCTYSYLLLAVRARSGALPRRYLAATADPTTASGHLLRERVRGAREQRAGSRERLEEAERGGERERERAQLPRV